MFDNFDLKTFVLTISALFVMTLLNSANKWTSNCRQCNQNFWPNCCKMSKCSRLTSTVLWTNIPTSEYNQQGSLSLSFSPPTLAVIQNCICLFSLWLCRAVTWTTLRSCVLKVNRLCVVFVYSIAVVCICLMQTFFIPPHFHCGAVFELSTYRLISRKYLTETFDSIAQTVSFVPLVNDILNATSWLCHSQLNLNWLWLNWLFPYNGTLYTY